MSRLLSGGEEVAGTPRERVRAAARSAGLSEGLAEQVVAAVDVCARAVPRRLGQSSGDRRVLVACDLDRTLIYSATALLLATRDSEAPPMSVAEVYEGVPISYWTRDAESMFAALGRLATVVPVTTRTRAQFARVHVPACEPRIAVTTNGGHILVEGRECPDWSREVMQRLNSSCAPLADVVAHLEAFGDAPWLRKRRIAEDLFAYLVVDRPALPPTFLTDLQEWCASIGWTVSLQGRKVYCVPEVLTKSAAVAEVAMRTGLSTVIAAGDSLLDAELLLAADLAIRPAHGELHAMGWHADHLTVTERTGVLGGQELVARLVAAVLTAGDLRGYTPSVRAARGPRRSAPWPQHRRRR